MGDNSIFSVFSNIWSSVHLKIPSQFQASWWRRLFSLDMTISMAMLLVFLYLIAAYASVRQCVIIICWCPQNIIEISLFQKKCSSKYVVKNARNVTQFVWQPFSIEFQGFVKKNINIYTRILDIMKLEQIHFMVVKK